MDKQVDKEGLLTDEEILIEVCANCTRENVWSDEDCKYCQMNMRVAKKAQHSADNARCKKKEEEWLEAIHDARHDGYMSGKDECQKRIEELI